MLKRLGGNEKVYDLSSRWEIRYATDRIFILVIGQRCCCTDCEVLEVWGKWGYFRQVGYFDVSCLNLIAEQSSI